MPATCFRCGALIPTLLAAALMNCSSSPRNTTNAGADQVISVPQSASVCESLRAWVNRRSSTLLRQPSGLPLPLSAYKLYVMGAQPDVLALINLEEQLYGVWRIPTDKGLCRLTMTLLEHPREAADVAQYMRTHDLDSPNSRLYDAEFQSLAESNDEESEYVNGVVGFRDRLADLGRSGTPLRKQVPIIGVNAPSEKEAAELFSRLQAQLDTVYGRLPPLGQRRVAEALNDTSH